VPTKLPPVMLLGDTFGYPAGVSHGVTTYYLNVVPPLSRVVDLTVCLLREPHPAAHELEHAGINPIFFSAHRMNPFVALQVAVLAKQRGCRILHASGMKAVWVARVVARLLDASVLVHVHDHKIPPGPVRLLHRMFARPTDLGICVSRAVGDNAQASYYVARDRLRTVYNCLDLSRFRQIAPDARLRVRAELGIRSDARVLALVGRFYAAKGQEEMIRMMPAIAARCPDVVLILVGDGPCRAACESLAAQLNIQSHLRFLGQRGDVADLLEASDLVVMPSQNEGFPLAVIEALAIGRPVVGFDVGGMGEAVDRGETGELVPARDMDAFIAAVVSLLDDPAALAAYSKRAFAAAEEFSISSHVAKLLECYGEVRATPLRAATAS
jgi:glycosyltransferase involved in cell wall biosynthesis